jgi:hypothetical protein
MGRGRGCQEKGDVESVMLLASDWDRTTERFSQPVGTETVGTTIEGPRAVCSYRFFTMSQGINIIRQFYRERVGTVMVGVHDGMSGGAREARRKR